jgi:hypothetical protein
MSLVKLADRQVGWDAGAGVVASLRFDRDGDDLVLVALECDDTAAMRELVDAVAEVATAPRIVGNDARLAELGFVSEDGRWARDVVAQPAPPDATHAITLGELEAAIRASWSAETCDRPDEWTAENPAFQHCDVTAHVVRDYLGGEILVAGVELDGRRVDRHAWNRLPSGLTVDLTREQFRRGERLEAPEVLETFIGPQHDERYELLAERVRAKLGA